MGKFMVVLLICGLIDFIIGRRSPICVAKRSMIRCKIGKILGMLKPDRRNYFLDNDLCVNSKEGVLEQEQVLM